MAVVAQFEIEYRQYMDKDANIVAPLPDFATDHQHLVELYKRMCFLNVFDKKTINLQRTGRMGTYPASIGQEAIGVGIGAALHKDDIYCPYYRDQGTLLSLGVSPLEVLSFWGGYTHGTNFQHPDCKEHLPYCIPIAGQCLHAAGAAFAIQYREESRAVLTSIGEGGTSKGDFYEAINLAGVWSLPLVFVVNNNQWAISVPSSQQTAAKTYAQKAIAAGIEGIQVDGNDVIAVQEAVDNALKKAKAGGGPSLIEAITYRLCDHTTVDDASRYVPEKEAKAAEAFTPIPRLRSYLHQQGVWDEEKELALQKEYQASIEETVKAYMNQSIPKQPDLFEHLYENVPFALLDQRSELLGEDS